MLLALSPLSPSGQNDWITYCSSDLATLVTALLFPAVIYANMTSDLLHNVGYAINSESHLATFDNMQNAMMSDFVNHTRIELRRRMVRMGKFDEGLPIRSKDGVVSIRYN